MFEAGMFEFDSGLALIHLADAQKLYRMDDRVSGVRLKVDDLFAAPRIGRELLRFLDADAWVSDWTRSHANFFRAVQIEKRMMFLILLLIVAVAAFNIVSTLVMAVTDKRADIAILRTLGASPGSIMAIFIVQGVADRHHRAGGAGARRRRRAGAQHRRRGAGAGACWAPSSSPRTCITSATCPPTCTGRTSAPSAWCPSSSRCWRPCIRAGAPRARTGGGAAL
jgi:hypothetical protein